MTQMQIEAVVFDLYNTLIWMKEYTNPIKLFFEDVGMSKEDIMKNLRNVSSENFENFTCIKQHFAPNSNLDTTPYQEALDKEMKTAELYPNSIQTLEAIKKRGLKTGLISNFATPYKEPFYELGLNQQFDHTLFSCEAGCIKPNQQIYQAMIDMLNVYPENVLMIGDSLKCDFNGPKTFGMNALLLDRNNKHPNVQNRIKSLSQIIDFI